jgi:hypothetical protein
MKLRFVAFAVFALAAATAHANYIKKTIPLSSPPGQVVIAGDIWVANGDKISVFDPELERFQGNIPVPHAYALAYSPVSFLTYASAVVNGVNQIWIFDGLEQNPIAKVPITSTPGDGITALAADPLGYTLLYVANASNQRVDIVSTFRGEYEVVKTISLSAKPTGIAMGALRGLAFVSLANGDVVAISLKTQAIVSTIQAGTSLSGIVVDPYGEQRVYALDTDAVGALDPSGTTIRYTFAVPPGAVAGSAFATTIYLGDGKYRYSGNHEIFITGPSGTSALNGITYHVIDTIPQAAGVSVATDMPNNKIYVTSSTSNELIVIQK